MPGKISSPQPSHRSWIPLHPKGGLRPGARPGGKDLLGKNQAACISWTRRASKLWNVDCGMRIEKENSKIRNPQFEIRSGRTGAFCTQCPCPWTTTLAFWK
jgi:hypothetical protein